MELPAAKIDAREWIAESRAGAASKRPFDAAQSPRSASLGLT